MNRTTTEVIIRQIEEKIKIYKKEKKTPVVVAIDGMSGAGKTTLAENLSNLFSAEVVHMDDFFLPMELRTESRKKEIGGNVDYERFLQEVVKGIHGKTIFHYGKFSCEEMKIVETIKAGSSTCIIIEGAYAMRPEFRNIYDLKYCMMIDPELQRRRIYERNGEAQGDIFFQRWIPMEMEYLDYFQIPEKCDGVVIIE